VSALDMVRTGERFYTSLGFAALPRRSGSIAVRPSPDRDVVCHASAWDIDLDSDIRIKMCIDQTEEDFTTIHHELGHNFYQRAYKDQPILFRDSANDGFHEAIGDTIALSVTPEYLVKIGLLDAAPDASHDLGLLMSRALDKIAFLPFGLLIDQCGGRYSPRGEAGAVQRGVVESPVEVPGHCTAVSTRRRIFDPGAKYHVPTTPRTRAISWRTSCSSSFIGRWPRPPVAPFRFIAAPPTTARKPDSGWPPCCRWVSRGHGRTLSKP